MSSALALALGACTLLVDPDESRIGGGDGGPTPVDSGATIRVDAEAPRPIDTEPAPLPDAGARAISGVSDPGDCGLRRLRCGDGQLCIDGGCTCAPPRVLLRDRTCADLASDPANCGAIGRACPSRCAAGECVGNCPDGTVDCRGGCTNIFVDPLNCGGCEVACEAGQVCVAGACQRVLETPGCVECPCPDCGERHACCGFERLEVALCVEGLACP